MNPNHRIRAAERRARRLRAEAPASAPFDNTATTVVAEMAMLTSWEQRMALLAFFVDLFPDAEPSADTDAFATWLAGPAIRRAVALGLGGREVDGFKLLVARRNFVDASAEASAVLEELVADDAARSFLQRAADAIRTARAAAPTTTARRRPANVPIPRAPNPTEDDIP